MAAHDGKVEKLAEVPQLAHKRRDGIARAQFWLPCLAVLGAVAFWSGEYLTRGDERYTPGPLASVHGTWDNNCAACHTCPCPLGGNNWLANATASTHIADKQCQTCHAGPAHHATEKPGEAPGCTSCHREHHGRTFELVRAPDSRCTTCHADLAAHVKDGKTAFGNVTRFDVDHPKFRTEREPKDPGNIAFNHKLHLTRGLRPTEHTDVPFTLADIPTEQRERYRSKDDADTTPVQLDCAACHRTDIGERVAGLPAVASPARPGGAHMLPITYEQHCQACHPLTIDRKEAKGGAYAVRHRLQPPEVHEVLRGYWTRQLLDGKLDVPVRPNRPLPGKDPKREEASQTSAATIAKLVQADERMLFSAGTCGKCHQSLVPGKGADQAIPASTLPQVWFEHAKFDHAAHRAVDCLECHAGIDASKWSSDVLLPGVAICAKCHAPPHREGGVPLGGARFDCAECHRYHAGDQPLHGKGAAARQPVARNTGIAGRP